MDFSHNPVDNILWVPVDRIYANDYNPNNVALTELVLLYVSIDHDGYTMPIVTLHDPERAGGSEFIGYAAGGPPYRPRTLVGGYVIVDGFHRSTIIRRYKDIYERNAGHLPIAVIKKSINDRMASTVRHNRARGKHSVGGMANMVMTMLQNGWGDARICSELGLEKEELTRLKHVTGYAKLYKDANYSRAMETPAQIKARLK